MEGTREWIKKKLIEDDCFYLEGSQGTRPVLVSNPGGKYKGYFHRFGSFSDGENNEVLAIIEDYEGNVAPEILYNIKFLDSIL